jgi:hypothetical protein
MRKTIQLTLVILIFSLVAKAQQKAWIDPSPTDPKKRVRIYVDLDKLDPTKNGLIGQKPPFYIWTWKPEDAGRLPEFKNGPSFSESNDSLIMKRDSTLGENVWFYEMIPTKFYNVTSEKVISTPIEFLVKAKNGSIPVGGSKEAKTEDLKIVVIPKITTRDTIYCSPFNLFPDEITTIYYNNELEGNPSMQNLGADSAYIYIKAFFQNGNSIESYTPRINSWKSEAMKLELQPGTRLFSKKLILNELLKEKNLDNEKLINIEVTVIKKGATNGKGVSKEISKIFLGCR